MDHNLCQTMGTLRRGGNSVFPYTISDQRHSLAKQKYWPVQTAYLAHRACLVCRGNPTIAAVIEEITRLSDKRRNLEAPNSSPRRTMAEKYHYTLGYLGVLVFEVACQRPGFLCRHRFLTAPFLWKHLFFFFLPLNCQTYCSEQIFIKVDAGKPIHRRE